MSNIQKMIDLADNIDFSELTEEKSNEYKLLLIDEIKSLQRIFKKAKQVMLFSHIHMVVSKHSGNDTRYEWYEIGLYGAQNFVMNSNTERYMLYDTYDLYGANNEPDVREVMESIYIKMAQLFSTPAIAELDITINEKEIKGSFSPIVKKTQKLNF